MNFSAVILAGGKSSRMGSDKARLRLGGELLLARQIRLVRESRAGETLVSAPSGKGYEEFGCRVLGDRFIDCGPLGGVESGLAASASPMALILAVDMPALTAEVIAWLKSECGAEVGAVPRVSGEIEPLLGFYPKSAQPLAETLLRSGRLAMKCFAESCVAAQRARWVEAPANLAGCFINWNSPQDFP